MTTEEIKEPKIGDLIIFDLLGVSKRKGEIVKIVKCHSRGLWVLTKKYAIPINRVRRIIK